MIKYIPVYDKGRKVMAYDTANGFEVYNQGWNTSIFIHARTQIVSEAYNTLREAVRAWGEWSNLPVLLPDGNTVRPSEYLHPGHVVSPFLMWYPSVREIWPGEVGL